MKLTAALLSAAAYFAPSARCSPVDIHVLRSESNATIDALPHQGGSCDFGTYLALGDSYAAGIHAQWDGQLPMCLFGGHGRAPYPSPCSTSKCARNKMAYPNRFAQRHNVGTLDFKACSGATTKTLQKNQLVPKLKTLGSDDLITITIGGNNGKWKGAFVNVVGACVYKHGFMHLFCEEALSSAKDTMLGLDDHLAEVFGQIKRAHRNPRVVVLGYAEFWPADRLHDESTCKNEALRRPTAKQKKRMNELVRFANKALSDVAYNHGFTFVDPNPRFKGHRLCDVGESWFQWDLHAKIPRKQIDTDDDWKDKLNLGVFHPTAKGQLVYTEALEAALGCN